MERTPAWMEESLRRTSELGRELLERAQSRDVDWWSVREGCVHSPRIRHTWESPEVEERPRSLAEAFSTLSHYMCQTTEQCEKYHSRIPAQEMDRREIQHFSRFHCRKPQQTPLRPPPPYLSSAAAPLQSSGRRRRDPHDVYIEVSPGTYSISASGPDYQKQSHLVHITPGQSVDLTFHV
ncbi:hypothetical protein GDO81_026266 [Engystomops pustulosus]|uniref:A-kinase interacting protein 1 n=1 Tax=Engystomops pustulosus TaxID=76066 RepID=A0AAV6YG61_ENGPU|nr:hypothetical protein GDO81_026266 [Engystomops pustulosus]